MTCRSLLLLTLALAGCAERGGPDLDGETPRAGMSGDSSAAPPPPARSPHLGDTIGVAGLDVGVEAELEGSEVALRLRVRNATAQTVTFEFPSGQRYDFAVSDDRGQVLWLWSAAALFAAEPGTVTLPPGEALEYEERWAPQGAAGRLVVEARLTSRNLPIVRSTRLTL